MAVFTVIIPHGTSSQGPSASAQATAEAVAKKEAAAAKKAAEAAKKAAASAQTAAEAAKEADTKAVAEDLAQKAAAKAKKAEQEAKKAAEAAKKATTAAKQAPSAGASKAADTAARAAAEAAKAAADARAAANAAKQAAAEKNDADKEDSGTQAGSSTGGLLDSNLDQTEIDYFVEESTALEAEVQEVAEDSQGIQIIGKIVEIQNDENISEALKADLFDCLSAFAGKPTGQDSTPSEENTDGEETTPPEQPLGQLLVRKLIDRNDTEAYGETLGQGYADFDMTYNYASRKYEDYTEEYEPPETRHPSFSNFVHLGEQTINTNVKSDTSLRYGEFEERHPRTYFTNLNSRAERREIEQGPIAQYYNKLYAALEREDVEQQTLSLIQNTNKTYYMSPQFVDMLKQKNYLKAHFPFHLNIELSSFPLALESVQAEETTAQADAYTPLAKLAKDNNISNVLMNAAITAAKNLDPAQQAQGPSGEEIRIWNFPLPYDSLKGTISQASMDHTANYFSPSLTAPSTGQKQKWLKGLTLSPLQHRVTETIMFKVCKYEQGSEDAIQETYIYNDETAGPLQIVDTQINIGKRYEYRVFAYEVAHISVGSDSGVEKISHLVEYEAFRISDVCLTNKPPMPPDVNILPYMGNENDLLFLFNDSSGKVMLEPVQIEDADAETIRKMMSTHGRRIADPNISQEDFMTASDEEKFKTLVEYEYDEKSEMFEVFRTDTPPMSYQDFKGRRLATVSGTSYVDRVAPNKKYYYTFRCRDGHDSLSNPSAVFEVEIVKTFNVFPNIRIYEFPDKVKETRETKKKAKKFIRISPDAKFLLIRKQGSSEDANSAFDVQDNAYTLGTENIADDIWSKKFKLRLTSKTSGRKIDFNFSFTKSFIGNT